MNFRELIPLNDYNVSVGDWLGTRSVPLTLYLCQELRFLAFRARFPAHNLLWNKTLTVWIRLNHVSDLYLSRWGLSSKNSFSQEGWNHGRRIKTNIKLQTNSPLHVISSHNRHISGAAVLLQIKYQIGNVFVADNATVRSPYTRYVFVCSFVNGWSPPGNDSHIDSYIITIPLSPSFVGSLLPGRPWHHFEILTSSGCILVGRQRSVKSFPWTFP